MNAEDEPETPHPPRGRPVSGAAPPDEPLDPDDEDEPAAPPPDPNSLRALYRDPGIRNYLFAGLAALAMVFVVMFSQGSDIGGVLLVVVGATGLVLRWPASPPLFLLFLTYFLIFPFGIPDFSDLYTIPFLIEDSRFQVFDLILVFSVLVFLVCVYRIFGLTWQAVPLETRLVRIGDKPTRRPTELIQPGEIPRLLYVTAGVVIVGQIVWLLVTALEVDIGSVIPLRFAEARQGRRGATPPGEMNPVITRLILLAGLLFFGTLLARLGFGYWRLRLMTPAEGGMLLQDAGWEEISRERVRVEKWRIWGRKRADRVKNAGREARNGGTR